MKFAVTERPFKDPECVVEDVERLQTTIDMLTARHWEEVPRPEGYDGLMTQALQAPNFSVAKYLACAELGFVSTVCFGVGGKETTPTLWASSMAIPEHARLIRSLTIAAWKHPLYGMINKACFGEMTGFRITDNGIESSEYSLEGESGELLPRAFMLGELVRRVRDYGLYHRSAEYYALLHDAGVRPLGFEEVHALGYRVVKDTLELNPELKPPGSADEE